MLNAGISVSTETIFTDKETMLSFNVYNLLGADGPDPGFSGFDYPLTQREMFLSLRQAF